MNELKQFLATLRPGSIGSDTQPQLERLLAACWHEFDGADQSRMHGSKLLGRMENVIWKRPLLTFVIERHGGTVLGSTRGELLYWELDLDKGTAAVVKTSHRQLAPMAPRVDIKALAKELVQLIVRGEQDDRIRWQDRNTVQVLASRLFPDGSGFKMTIEGRRTNLSKRIEEALKPLGWLKVSRTEFRRQEGPKS